MSPFVTPPAHRRVLTSAAFLGCVLGASPAYANTVTNTSNQLSVVAAAGETNAYVVTAAGSVYTVEDLTTNLTAGTGCVQITVKKVSCTNAAMSSVSVSAGDGNDSITANTPLASTLVGDDGNDTVASLGAGADTLSGGNGVDTVTYAAFPAAVQISPGATYDDGPIVGTKDSVSQTFETFIGSDYADTISGGTFAVNLQGGAGNDTLTAGSGGAILDGGNGDDSITGGTGVDNVEYPGRVRPITFSLPSNTITVALSGGATETDTVTASTIERYYGGLSNDSFVDIAGNQSLFGGGGDDTFTLPGGGNDYVDGGDGNDDITDGAGNDTFIGGIGDDVFWLLPSGGSDVVNGGNNSDTVNLSMVTSAVVTLDGNTNDGPFGAPAGELDNIQDDVEKLIGGSGTDSFTASTTSFVGVTFDGGSGGDKLTGGPGNDTLIGGSGTDLFYGNAGSDNIQAKDGVAETTVDCGANADTASVDVTDVLTGCETVTY